MTFFGYTEGEAALAWLVQVEQRGNDDYFWLLEALSGVDVCFYTWLVRVDDRQWEAQRAQRVALLEFSRRLQWMSRG